MKQCIKCLREKPITEFSQNQRNKTGRNGSCKECDKARLKAKRASDRRIRNKEAWEAFKQSKKMGVLPVRYERFGDMNDPCIYCGRASDTRDRVPPRCFGPSAGKGYVYSACGECNSSLSGRPLMTLSDRRAYLIGRYEKAYENILDMPDWSENELLEMHEDTAEEIRSWLGKREAIREILKQLKRKRT